MKPRWPVLALIALLPSCMEPDEAPPPPLDEWDAKLAERVVDYSAALRIAALRLTGELPTLDELKRVGGAPDEAARRAAYEALLHQYVQGPRFARQMFRFWQDTLKMGGGAQLDSAPAFLAQLAVEDRSYLDALTARSGTCPTFNQTTNTFTSGECGNAPQTVGLLTHPGMHAHFFGNLAFRRVRWVQETFACTAFPAEIAPAATDIGALAPYTGTFPFASIAGELNGGRVDFLSKESVICANCHSNMNHIAPLFAHFNEVGAYTSAMSVPTPLSGAPLALRTDFLPSSEGLAWRSDVPVTDMAGLGAAMAADPDVAACAVARLWNWALGKPDIVDAAVRVPAATIEKQVAAFAASGYRIRAALLEIFTSDDFVRF